MEIKLEIANKVLLFDFDGTVVETEIIAKKVIEQYFTEQNIDHGTHFADMIVGRTWKAATESMIEHALSRGVEIPESGVLQDLLKARYRQAFELGVPLVPGFNELLPHFKSQAKFLGIVTGSDRHEVSSILTFHGLQESFGQVWGYGDYPRGKPHPDPYLTALSALKADPKDVIVFEDSKVGMEAARQAGLSFVQIAHEAHAKERHPDALLYLESWHDLILKRD